MVVARTKIELETKLAAPLTNEREYQGEPILSLRWKLHQTQGERARRIGQLEAIHEVGVSPSECSPSSLVFTAPHAKCLLNP